MLLLNCTIWLISYIGKNDYESILDTSIMMFEAFAFLLIGTGFFVRGQKGLGIWKLVKAAFRLESKEADYLIKRFFRPVNAR